MTIYICIVSYNRPLILSECLDSIRAGAAKHGARICILQMEDGSGDENHVSSSFRSHVTKIQLRQNLGCGGGRKYLAKYLLPKLRDDDITVWLDDDLVTLGDNWLGTLIYPIASKEADIAGVEGMLVMPDGLTKPCGNNPPDYVSGGWCAIAGRVFRAGCMFDELYFPNYFEDVDFCFQAREKGFRVAVSQNTGLFHAPHPGNAQFFERSRKRFRKKWLNQEASH